MGIRRRLLRRPAHFATPLLAMTHRILPAQRIRFSATDRQVRGLLRLYGFHPLLSRSPSFWKELRRDCFPAGRHAKRNFVVTSFRPAVIMEGTSSREAVPDLHCGTLWYRSSIAFHDEVPSRMTAGSAFSSNYLYKSKMEIAPKHWGSRVI